MQVHFNIAKSSRRKSSLHRWEAAINLPDLQADDFSHPLDRQVSPNNTRFLSPLDSACQLSFAATNDTRNWVNVLPFPYDFCFIECFNILKRTSIFYLIPEVDLNNMASQLKPKYPARWFFIQRCSSFCNYFRRYPKAYACNQKLVYAHPLLRLDIEFPPIDTMAMERIIEYMLKVQNKKLT